MQHWAEAFVPIGNNTEFEAVCVKEFEDGENVIEDAPSIRPCEVIV